MGLVETLPTNRQDENFAALRPEADPGERFWGLQSPPPPTPLHKKLIVQEMSGVTCLFASP